MIETIPFNDLSAHIVILFLVILIGAGRGASFQAFPNRVWERGTRETGGWEREENEKKGGRTGLQTQPGTEHRFNPILSYIQSL